MSTIEEFAYDVAAELYGTSDTAIARCCDVEIHLDATEAHPGPPLNDVEVRGNVLAIIEIIFEIIERCKEKERFVRAANYRRLLTSAYVRRVAAKREDDLQGKTPREVADEIMRQVSQSSVALGVAHDEVHQGVWND